MQNRKAELTPEQIEALSDVPRWIPTTIPWEQCDEERRALLRESYLTGELSWKLSPSQRGVYDNVEGWRKKSVVRVGELFAFDCSRRWGKSALEWVLLSETCLKLKGARCLFIAPEWEQIRKYIFPIVGALSADTPPEVGLAYSKSERTYTFRSTGSVIQLVGLDRNPNAARGGAFDLAALDETGFFDNLEELLDSVLRPMMMGKPWSRIFCGSTPATTPDHYWSEEIVPKCIALGALDHRTRDDADQYSPREIELRWQQIGGRNSVKGRREYGAEHIVDTTRAIFPEYAEAVEPIQTPLGVVIPGIVREVEPPAWRDCYVAMDPGWADMTGILFGYWYWEWQALVIEDEALLSKENSRRIAVRIARKEATLWKDSVHRGPSGQPRPQPYMRVSDNDHRLISDLHTDYGLTFFPTNKTELKEHVNKVRVAIESRKIIIHPRCVKLQKQLRGGVWKKSGGAIGNEFARTGDFGHFDLLAALVYMWRNVKQSRNPAPEALRLIAGMAHAPAIGPRSRGKPVEQKARRWGRPTNSRWQRKGGQHLYIHTGKTKDEKLKNNDWGEDFSDDD